MAMKSDRTPITSHTIVLHPSFGAAGLHRIGDAWRMMNGVLAKNRPEPRLVIHHDNLGGPFFAPLSKYPQRMPMDNK